LAQDEQKLRTYLNSIRTTLQELLTDRKVVAEKEIKMTADFLSRIADYLLDSARESSTRYPSDEPVPGNS